MGFLSDVPGVKVGHWQDETGLTGCTVVLPPPGTVGGVAVLGGAPGTRETELLRPGTWVEEVSALLLTGGSAFGLAAAEGVVRWCEERGIGHETGVARVPIVPAAVIFDLSIGDSRARPGPEAGYAAASAASEDTREGNVGAGMGATVGKWAGLEWRTKGGLGQASRRVGDVVVAALAVVNAVGDVLGEDGRVLAGARKPGTASLEGVALGWPGASGGGGARGAGGVPPEPGTTLAVVATNAGLDKAGANRVAREAAAGLARAVKPVFSRFDGDLVFVLATGEVQTHTLVGLVAAEVVAEAVRRGVLAASSVPGAPAARDLGSAAFM